MHLFSYLVYLTYLLFILLERQLLTWQRFSKSQHDRGVISFQLKAFFHIALADAGLGMRRHTLHTWTASLYLMNPPPAMKAHRIGVRSSRKNTVNSEVVTVLYRAPLNGATPLRIMAQSWRPKTWWEFARRNYFLARCGHNSFFFTVKPGFIFQHIFWCTTPLTFLFELCML